MYSHLVNRWDAARDSFWFVPGLLSFLALVLALVCGSLDAPAQRYFVRFAPWVGVSTSAARASLGTIGSAMVSIAGIVFSVMLVTLSVTSSQYGSRLLRTFMSDRFTQCVLGVLVGTSLFCMVALAGIRDRVDGDYQANVSVIVGLVLAVISLAVLVGFIHHVSSLIQAPNVVAAVARDLDASFERLFPEREAGQRNESEDDLLELGTLRAGAPVLSSHEGYVQALDYQTLVEIAEAHDIVVRLAIKPGEFVERNQQAMEVWPREAVVIGAEEVSPDNGQVDFGAAFASRINDTIITGRRRTPRQDPECALDELVEVAVRALSPGINDPFTAIACIDRLAAALGRAAERSMPTTLRRDAAGVPRVLTRSTTFADLMDAAFNQIRQHGCQTVAVAIRMIQAFSRITTHAVHAGQIQSLRRHAAMLERDFRQHVKQPEDGDDFEARYTQLCEDLRARDEKLSHQG